MNPVEHAQPCSDPFARHSIEQGPRSLSSVFERTLSALNGLNQAPQLPANDLSSPDVLRLQVEMYRQAEQIELASKLLDHGVSAVKTILQTRI